MAELHFYQAAGNRFAIVDGFAINTPEVEARRILSGPLIHDWNLDGVLICGPSRTGADCRMEVFNRDGSSAEACGNGLRCIARFAFEHGRAAEKLRIETAAGERSAHVRRHTNGTIQSVRTSMGKPRIIALEERIVIGDTNVLAAIIDMGNPHCVVFVEDVHSAPVAAHGPLLENHMRFPKRTNVGFAHVSADALELRVWERGVGETEACGTGAAAAAAVAFRLGLSRAPLAVRSAGGTVSVDQDGENELYLEGPALPISEPAPLAP